VKLSPAAAGWETLAGVSVRKKASNVPVTIEHAAPQTRRAIKTRAD